LRVLQNDGISVAQSISFHFGARRVAIAFAAPRK